MFKSTLALSAVAALSVVSAQDIGRLAGYINKNLTAQCITSVFGASEAARGYCGVDQAVDLFQGNTSTIESIWATGYYIAENSTVLNKTCSAGCGNFLNDYAYDALNICGAQNLLDANKSEGLVVTASDLVNVLRYSRRALCVPSSSEDSTYCVQYQVTAFRDNFPDPTNVTVQEVLANPNITGIPCAVEQSQQLNNYTSLSPQWQDILSTYVEYFDQAVNASQAAVNQTGPSKRDSRLFARARFSKYI